MLVVWQSTAFYKRANSGLQNLPFWKVLFLLLHGIGLIKIGMMSFEWSILTHRPHTPSNNDIDCRKNNLIHAFMIPLSAIIVNLFICNIWNFFCILFSDTLTKLIAEKKNLLPKERELVYECLSKRHKHKSRKENSSHGNKGKATSLLY